MHSWNASIRTYECSLDKGEGKKKKKNRGWPGELFFFFLWIRNWGTEVWFRFLLASLIGKKRGGVIYFEFSGLWFFPEVFSFHRDFQNFQRKQDDICIRCFMPLPVFLDCDMKANSIMVREGMELELLCHVLISLSFHFTQILISSQEVSKEFCKWVREISYAWHDIEILLYWKWAIIMISRIAKK